MSTKKKTVLLATHRAATNRLEDRLHEMERERDKAQAAFVALQEEMKHQLAKTGMSDVERFIAGELDWYAAFDGTLDSQPSGGGAAFSWTDARKFAAKVLADTFRRMATERGNTP